MGQVSRFIDEVCASHPELMAAVLERPFSRLSEWIDWDAEGGPCGCVIGTMALVAGIAEADWKRDTPDFVADVIRDDTGHVEDIGVRVFEMSLRLAHGTIRNLPLSARVTHESDQRVIQMIRTRIARELVIRETARVEVGV